MKPSKELLERCRKDDRKAHYDLYRECFQSLYAICRRYYINKDDCMAALNMVFYKMVKNISTYIPKAKDVPLNYGQEESQSIISLTNSEKTVIIKD
ncbi:MAG: hypothetical protein IPF75_14805 [Bacteroidetes bacterium]|nr:hypothetical protein [Bacteroidota bacterium]